jgi:mevalonate kinase
VDASTNFGQTVNLVVWKQERTFTNNLLCGQINCYSNCQIDYQTNIPLDLRGFFGRSCPECKHSLRNHHRCHAKWNKVVDTQVSVDSDMTERWEAAKDRTEKAAVMVAASEKVLKDLDQIINHAVSNLTQLVGRYARLSLSGSFAAQVRSAVRLLELNYHTLEKNGVGQERLKKVKESLRDMGKKLELLDSVKADVMECVGRG